MNRFQEKQLEKLLSDFFVKRERPGGKRTYPATALVYEIKEFLVKEKIVK